MYISKSSNGGRTWTQVARVDSQYFDADIGEGERNGLGVSPGGKEFVITTQRGAFQVIPRSSRPDAFVRPIAGPRVTAPDPTVTIPKKEGDPVSGKVYLVTADFTPAPAPSAEQPRPRPAPIPDTFTVLVVGTH